MYTAKGNRKQKKKEIPKLKSKLKLNVIVRIGNNRERVSAQDSFGEAFNDTIMTPNMIAKDLEIRQQVAADDDEFEKKVQAERNRVGDAVGWDGSVLFVDKLSGTEKGQVATNRATNLSAAQQMMYQRHLESYLTPVRKNLCSLGRHCRYPELRHYHKCYSASCSKKIHSLCAQGANLLSMGNELNIYCSEVCKSKNEK